MGLFKANSAELAWAGVGRERGGELGRERSLISCHFI